MQIISRETIKPSSPTPPHLYIYNLSPIDHIAIKSYTPIFLIYPKNANCTLTPDDKTIILKKSLSHTLTQYYPLAGRMTTPTTPYVDCNDQGVVFLEARVDTNIDAFLNLREQDNTLHQFFANDLECYTSPRNTSLVGVQLNHFACGGIGIAVSISHVLGDACTLSSFLSHWAAMAHYGSNDHKQVQPFNPVFLHSQPTNNHDSNSHVDPVAQVQAQPQAQDMDHKKWVTRKFVFPNSKLSELKDKVVFESGGCINNPSRVEVLTSLLYKTAAATTKCDNFNPSYLFMMFNVRDKFVPKLSRSTFGNLASVMMTETRPHTSDEQTLTLSAVVAEIKKYKLQLEGGIQSVQQVADNLNMIRTKLISEYLENAGDLTYWCSSFCGFAFNKLDFGLGNPRATIPVLESSNKNGVLLIDTADGDGIQAWVSLEKQRMEIFENDNELLSFCQIN